jgi:hypothetical protein
MLTVLALDRMQHRIREIRAVAPRALGSASAQIEETLRSDSKSKRGNVPSYGKFGNVPISAAANDTEIRVTAAAWVIARARDLGQPAKWAGIIRAKIAAALAGGG